MDINPLWSLRVFLRPYRGTVILAFLVLLLACFFYLMMPVMLRSFFDYGLRTVVGQSWWMVGVSLLVTLGFALTSAWRFYLVSWVGERVVADLRLAVFSQVLFYRYHFY